MSAVETWGQALGNEEFRTGAFEARASFSRDVSGCSGDALQTQTAWLELMKKGFTNTHLSVLSEFAQCPKVSGSN